MFKHDKRLLEGVRVDRPNPDYASLLSEQLGGPQGELKAAMQYISQSFRVKDPEIRDLMLDIGAEELSHMEMVSTAITQLNGHDVDDQSVYSGHVQSQTLFGLAPGLVNSSGVWWSGGYVNVTGDLVADLLSDMAAEQRAKVVYEYLYRQIDDSGVRGMIDFLLNREEAHNALFREALDKVRDTGSNVDYGTTEDAKRYVDASKPGRYFGDPNRPTPQGPASH